MSKSFQSFLVMGSLLLWVPVAPAQQASAATTVARAQHAEQPPAVDLPAPPPSKPKSLSNTHKALVVTLTALGSICALMLMHRSHQLQVAQEATRIAELATSDFI